jgi:hypothetical protein
MSVCGLPLPTSLALLLRDGRWKVPPLTVLSEVFNDEPEDPRFYDLESMVRQNELYRASEFNRLARGGAPEIEPTVCVLIGDLGIDTAIALDYRLEPTNPRVLYLPFTGWREVAPDFETLRRRLGM